MVVEIIIAGAILALTVVLYKGVNITINVNHKSEQIQATVPTVADLKSMKEALSEELSVEEDKFYKSTMSVIGRVNELMYGKPKEDKE
jgi:hypothetical protein